MSSESNTDPKPDLAQQVIALTDAAGLVELKDWTTIQLTGEDRVALLHNFCTADIRGMEDGSVREAFILDGKGKTLGHVWVLKQVDRIWLSTTPGQAERLIDHLDRYVIRDDVVFQDLTDSVRSGLVAGAKARESLSTAIPDWNGGSVGSLQQTDAGWLVASAELAGNGWLVVVPTDEANGVQQQLIQSGIRSCSLDALHVLRVRHRTPWYGIDIGPDNLPQELDRDERAISFDKGCYLGQETVARIDALGRVNRRFRRFRITSPEPVWVGQEIEVEGKPVGRITTLVWEPIQNEWQALGFIHRTKAAPGTKLTPEIIVLD